MEVRNITESILNGANVRKILEGFGTPMFKEFEEKWPEVMKFIDDYNLREDISQYNGDTHDVRLKNGFRFSFTPDIYGVIGEPKFSINYYDYNKTKKWVRDDDVKRDKVYDTLVKIYKLVSSYPNRLEPSEQWAIIKNDPEFKDFDWQPSRSTYTTEEAYSVTLPGVGFTIDVHCRPLSDSSSVVFISPKRFLRGAFSFVGTKDSVNDAVDAIKKFIKEQDGKDDIHFMDFDNDDNYGADY